MLVWSLVATVSSHAARPMSSTTGGATVTLSPSSILANGTSQTMVTTTGFPVGDLTVVFTSSDSGETVTNTSNPLTGTYTATITSSTTVSTPAAPVTIMANDGTLSGQASLIQFGPATGVSVQLAPTSIIANGTSTTTATATVTDVNGNPVPGQTVVLLSTDANETITQPSTPTGTTGTVSGTIRSSTTVGTSTITAAAAGKGGTATLTQTGGPATNVSVTLNPTSIPASGLSTTTATATVTDAQSHPVLTDTVGFAAPGDTVGPTTNHHDGTYTATITSSTTPGTVSVVAIDQTAGAFGLATLTQTTGPSTTVLGAVPAQPVTNQNVTLIATVTVSLGSPSGTVNFDNRGSAITGCTNVPVAPATTGNSAATATCQASFAAAGSPTSLTATFTPSAGNLGGSASPVDSLTVGRDSTATNLAASSSNPTTGSTVTYVASTAPAHAGAAQPSGSVRFSDGTTTLSGCGSQPLHGGSASCTVKFSSRGNHAITALYGGDANFGSASASITTSVHRPPPPQPLLSLLGWQFRFTPSYTNVQILAGHRVPAGASIQIKCHGHGCPYAKRTIFVSNAKHCKTTKTRRCTKHQSTLVDLFAAFLHHRLHAGTTLRVEILRPGWIGKYYLFTMRPGQAPSQRLACLPPGRAGPVSC